MQPIDRTPSTILHNAQVRTLDRSSTIAQALAVKDEWIMAVGSDDDVLATAGPHTRVVDLGGRTVVPGFVDTHAHLDREGLRRAYPTLQGCRSISDVQQVVRRAAAGRPPGEWVVILPLGEPPFHVQQAEMLAERRFPHRHDLDTAAPDNPVWIRAIWGYWNNTPPFVHILNSAALRACGIDRDAPSPASTVEIERDPTTGELTGRILERHIMPAAEYTLLRAAPRFTRQVRLAGLREAMRLHVAAGTTSVYEGHGVAAEVRQLYKELHDRGEQLVRAYLPLSLAPYGSMAEAERMLADWAADFARSGLGDDWLKLGGIYVGYGGHPELARISQAAWPYTGWAGFTDQCNTPDEYRELCRIAGRHRLRVGTSIGTDLDAVLRIWEEVDRDHPIRDLRWVLIHAREVDPVRDFPRIRRLGAVLTTQPASYLYRSGLALLRGGADERHLMAYRDWDAAGIPWSLSSDNKPYQMLFTLWVAMARREQTEDRVIGPDQRLDFLAALRAATAAGAYCCFDETQRGTLEPGKLADLVVLADEPIHAEPDALLDVRIDLTMVGGRIVHESPLPLGEG